MPRFFLSPESWQQHTQLDEEESKHASQVLRLCTGDDIVVFDGKGKSAHAQISKVHKRGCEIDLLDEILSPPLHPKLHLTVAVPKGKMMDWIIEKSVELGVAEIHPVITKHTIVKYDDGDLTKKAEKWQRIALEACKQCGQNFLPKVHLPQSFESFLTHAPEGTKIIASLADGAMSLRQVLLENIADIYTILVGPEGDFTQSETQSAIAKDFRPVTLGNIVLRVETAALFALSAVRYQTM